MIDGAADLHHGDIIRTEFLEPRGWSAADLAGALELPVEDVRAVIDGRDGINQDMARRLARVFQTPIVLWLNLQAGHWKESRTNLGASHRTP